MKGVSELSSLSRATIERPPNYNRYLKLNQNNWDKNISSASIASALCLGEVQVRKDLATICDGGKPRVGYDTVELFRSLEKALGYNIPTEAVIVGAGKLGRALLNYTGFDIYNIQILGAFDIKKDLYDGRLEKIYPLEEFNSFCRGNQIEIGIITTPSEYAQSVCDMFLANGIKAIWNFTQTRLNAPCDVMVQNESLANSLAILSAQQKI